jgi:hypothetical protein
MKTAVPSVAGAFHYVRATPAFSAPQWRVLAQDSAALVDGRAPAGFHVVRDAIDRAAETVLLADAEAAMARVAHERGTHWDAVIRGYRECEVSPHRFSAAGRAAMAAVAQSWLAPLFESGAPAALRLAADSDGQGFDPAAGLPLRPMVHILELDPDGNMAAHVDSVRFSGGAIAAISLAADCVYSMEEEENGEAGGGHGGPDAQRKAVHVLLPRRSLYMATGEARYRWRHAIRDRSRAAFRGTAIPAQRRISLIFRDFLFDTNGEPVFFPSSKSNVLERY